MSYKSSPNPPVVSSKFWNVLSVLGVVVLLVVVAGCDAVKPESNSVDTQSEDDEVQIRAKSFTRADLTFEPVPIAPGKTFSIQLMDEQLGQDVTRISHEGTEGGRHLLRARFDPLKPASVTVQCRNEKAGTRRKMATLGGSTLKSAQTDEHLVARGDPQPTSYHYIEMGDNVIVEVDYGEGGANGGMKPGGMFKFPSSDEPVECTHVAFELEDVSTSLSADGIRFSGDRQPTFRRKRLR